MSHVPLEGLGVFLGRENIDKTAAYLLGAGVVGIMAGFGLGADKPNKLMLIVGAGALLYGNHINPLIELRPSTGVSRSVTELKGKLPSVPSMPSFGGGRKPVATFTFS